MLMRLTKDTSMTLMKGQEGSFQKAKVVQVPKIIDKEKFQ